MSQLFVCDRKLLLILMGFLNPRFKTEFFIVPEMTLCCLRNIKFH